LAQPNKQPTSVSLSLLRSSLISRAQSSGAASSPCFTHTDARRRISLLHAGAVSSHLLPHGSRRYSVARPSPRCSWLHALSLPPLPSLPPAAAPSDPPQMTQAATDLVGMSEEVAVWPLPIDFLCFWLGDGDALHPASASTTRRRLFFFWKGVGREDPYLFFFILLYIWARIQRIK